MVDCELVMGSPHSQLLQTLCQLYPISRITSAYYPHIFDNCFAQNKNNYRFPAQYLAHDDFLPFSRLVSIIRLPGGQVILLL
jgi:hypothetical protein